MRQTKYNKASVIFQGKAGFSLVELMVVIGIIAIMAAAGTPSFLNWLPNYRLRSAARDIYSTLQNARLLAVRENTSVRVVFNNLVSPGFYIVDINNNGVMDQPGEYRHDLASYGSGVDFGFPVNPGGFVDWSGGAVGSAITFGGGPPPFCTYNSDGTVGSGTVYLVNDEDHLAYAITTVTSGAVKLRKYNGILPYNQNNWIE